MVVVVFNYTKATNIFATNKMNSSNKKKLENKETKNKMPKDIPGIFDFVYSTLRLGRQRNQVPNTKHTRDRKLGN